MVKFQFFGLFLAFFGLFSVSASPALARTSHGVNMEEQCNLPAPDSFRIIQTGGEFIQLAWKPIFPGATHQLTIMESDGIGGYVTILEENHVPGDTYIAEDLLPGTGYRFVLATKCPSGEPSEIKTIFDGITLIVDLQVEGRRPAHILPTGDCEFIPMGFKWMGFKVEGVEDGQAIENYFELELSGQISTNLNLNTKVKVKRYGLENPLVAVDEFESWPSCINPVKENVSPRFRIDKLIDGGPNRKVIGFVNLSQNFSFPSFSVCPDYNDLIFPWNSNYNLIPLVAHKTNPPQLCEGTRILERDEASFNNNGLIVNNPFGQNLLIQVDSTIVSNVKLELLDMYGKVILVGTVEDEEEIVLNTANIPCGPYLLRVYGQKFDFKKILIKK